MDNEILFIRGGVKSFTLCLLVYFLIFSVFFFFFLMIHRYIPEYVKEHLGVKEQEQQ